MAYVILCGQTVTVKAFGGLAGAFCLHRRDDIWPGQVVERRDNHRYAGCPAAFVVHLAAAVRPADRLAEPTRVALANEHCAAQPRSGNTAGWGGAGWRVIGQAGC